MLERLVRSIFCPKASHQPIDVGANQPTDVGANQPIDVGARFTSPLRWALLAGIVRDVHFSTCAR